jgi:hypothetical protein
MMKSLVISACSLMLGLMSYAQNESDVLLYTGLEYGGTSRFVGMGSSFGALGGDISSLATNPAGLGLYRHGEFTVTPSFVSSASSSTYYGNEESINDFDFTIGNIGYAQVYELKGDKWKNAQFGFAYNRLKDFHADQNIKGDQDDSSLLDFISAEALGVDSNTITDYDPFYIGPAYFTFLINPFVDGNGIYYEDVIGPGTDKTQEVSLRNRGRVSETVFGGSANYDDRLYIGAAMTFQRAVRDELMTYTETIIDTSATDLVFYELYQDLETRGDGINFKLGAIFRATDNIRIGGSYTTPTWYTFENTWSTDWTSEFNNGDAYSEPSFAVGINQYNLRTPSRLMGSIGFVIAKQALINVEYEYLDFSGAKFKQSGGSDIDFTRENNEIARQYAPVGNVRVGGEYRYKRFSLRGGYGFYPSPFEEGLTQAATDKSIYSGGIGYRKDRFNLDLAYRLTQFESDYYPYDPDLVQPALVNTETHSVMATVGFRF